MQVRLEMVNAKGEKRVRGHKAKGLTDRGAKDEYFHNEAEGRQMNVAEWVSFP